MFDPKSVEKEVQEFWDKNKVPETIVKMNNKKKKFYLLDGPPYVNGVPHVGHIKTTTFKDVWGKFKHMQGFSVWFQPGFDCGGLPIENKVEKDLELKSKKDIEEKIGIGKFIEECKKFAKGNEPVWLDLYKKIGAWRGWLEPYLTSENYYLESGWWTLKKLHEKGMFIQGSRPGFWCPHCETVLAGYEVTESYKEVEDPSIFFEFPIKGRKNEFLLVWTTTPWTLPANVAVAVHPGEIYVKAEVGGKKLILAKNRLDMLTELGFGYKIEDEFKGTELDGIKYEPVLEVPLQKEINGKENCHRLILSVPLMKKRVASKIQENSGGSDEFGHIVDVESGTGLVHIAPGHGDVDNKIGKHYNLPAFSPIDEKGCLEETAGEFKGVFAKDADKKIIDNIRNRGLLLYTHKITHSYPLCWRCKTPLLYRMSKQWFLTVDQVKNKMIEENEKVKWLPEFAKDRMRNVLTDAPDWAITRQRYWGIPAPVWICDSCKEIKVIGSKKELKENALEEVGKDLHKHSVDNIHLKCSCGGTMSRIPDVMDVWFDSGIAPWASLGYPHKNKELFENLKPVDLIDESQDQVRGWFYSLLFCGTSILETAPYKTVCLNGWTLDEKGEKMSKSVGNVIWAEDAFKELGADILRLYCCYDTAPWETQKFSLNNAKELNRNLDILTNIYNYFKTYHKIENSSDKLKTEDKWILSRVNSIVREITDKMEIFRFHEASRGLMNFIVEELSRVYIKLIRGRADKNTSYVLTYTLDKILRMMAPFTPFTADWLYYKMFGNSVHLSPWPGLDETVINEGLEEEMKNVGEVVRKANALRQEEGIKLRWTLKTLSTNMKVSENVKDIVKRLANVEDVAYDEKQKEDVLIDKAFDQKDALLKDLKRAIQQKRKENNLIVSDKIELYIDSEDMKPFEKDIKSHVGAKKIMFGPVAEPMATVTIGSLKAGFSFKKI